MIRENDRYIPMGHPDLALIKCVQEHYSGPLTIEAIAIACDRLYRDYGVRPVLLFVSRRGHIELRQRTYMDCSQVLEIHLVTLPTLPEWIFLLGNLDIEQKAMPDRRTQLASTTRVPKPYAK